MDVSLRVRRLSANVNAEARLSVAMGVVGRRLALGIWLVIHCALTLVGLMGYALSRLLNWITSNRIAET